MFGLEVVVVTLIVAAVAGASTKLGQRVVRRAVHAVLIAEGILEKDEVFKGQIAQRRLRHALAREPRDEKDAEELRALLHQQQVAIEQTRLDVIKANGELLKADAAKRLADGNYTPLGGAYTLPSQAQLTPPPPPFPEAPLPPEVDLDELRRRYKLGPSYAPVNPVFGEQRR